VLTGGGAQLKGIADYAKQALQLSSRVGVPAGLGGVSEEVSTPAFAVASGLMISDLLGNDSTGRAISHDETAHGTQKGRSVAKALTGIFSRFRS
jgi:cell division protein FtsA